jgi:hypothetical protein
MQAKHSLEFARAPALWSMYPKILVSRKPTLVPEGAEVPRIEARLARVNVDRKHLAAYSEICGASAGATLPIAYPHVLAMPLHLAMLGAEAFPVKLFGLVHVQNRIAMRQPLSADEPAEIRSWIEGHRDGERGQEFELHTEYVVAGEALWDETCTFLARRRSPAGAKPASPRPGDVPDGAAIRVHLGRRQSHPHERPLGACFRLPEGHRPWHVVARTPGVGFRVRTIRRRLRAQRELQAAGVLARLADAAALEHRERLRLRVA